MRPFGQNEAPVIALAEPIMFWAWQAWLVAAVATALILAYAAVRKPFAEFRYIGETCGQHVAVITDSPSPGEPGEPGCRCTLGTLYCRESSATVVHMSIAAVSLYGLLIIMLAFDLWRGHRRLAGRLHLPNRHTHALLTISQRFSLTAVAVFVLTAIAANLPGWEDETASVLGVADGGGLRLADELATPRTCATYANIIFGNPATNAIMAVIAAVELALVWPMLAAACRAPMHEHLQRFVWVDADLPAAKAARDKAALPMDTSEVPMFSMQRAVNLFFWMNLAYKLSSADHMQGSIDPAVAAALGHSHRPAMALFGLTQLRLFWERRCDTKATVAWGRSAIVISWRGTNTLKNARMDLQLARTPLPGAPACDAPRKASLAADMCTPCGLLGMLCRSVPVTRPMVHSGFWETYQSSGLSQRLLMHVFSLLESGEVDRETCTIYLCGHSLGGALAILNSLDIAAGCGLRREQVVVYTIGCPRVGDRAFAQHADAAVPNTWHIINGRDIVTQWGKCAGVFKSTGQRVIINQRHQLIIRPSFFEYVLHRISGRSHLREHLPGKYLERLAVALGRVQQLCSDPRESSRIAALLSANPTTARRSDPPASAAHATRRALHSSASSQHGGLRPDSAVSDALSEACSRAIGRDASDGGSCNSSSGSESDGARGDESPVWSSVRTGSELSSQLASPVVFGDVLKAFCSAEQEGAASDHEAVASVISDASHAGDSPLVMLGDAADAARSAAGTRSKAGSTAGSGSGSGMLDLPPVFVGTGSLQAGGAPQPQLMASPVAAASPRHGGPSGHPTRVPQDMRVDLSGIREEPEPASSHSAQHASWRSQRGPGTTSAIVAEAAAGAAGDAAGGAAGHAVGEMEPLVTVLFLGDEVQGVEERRGARTMLRGAGTLQRLRRDHDAHQASEHAARPQCGMCCGSAAEVAEDEEADEAEEQPRDFSAVARRMLDHRS